MSAQTQAEVDTGIPGKRLIASTIDAQAVSRPNEAIFSIPKDASDLSKGFRDITCKSFSNAINHAAVWLVTNVGALSNAPFDAIAYSGPNDLRYPILAVAASKVGKQILFPYSLAPALVKKNMILSTGCKTLLHPTNERETAQQLLADAPHIKTVTVPELDHWLNANEIAPFPYPKSYDEGKDDPWLIFHTSGTTGFPKIITYTNRMMTSFDIAQGLPEHKEHTQLGWHSHRRCFSVVPLSHFSGLCAALQAPFFLHSIIVQGPATKAPSPRGIIETLRYSQAKGFVAPPFLLRALTQQPPALEILKSLDYIQWIGAALDAETGNFLSKYVKICPAMGTTECGPYFLETADSPKDWAYYRFQSGQGIHFEERGDKLYELVFKKDPDAVWQQVFSVFPDTPVYQTRDLFQPHPDKEGLWAYVGRSDDIVVLSNSANIDAASVEETISNHPSVQMGFVGGNGRERPFLVIELTPAASEIFKEKGFEITMKEIWPVIEEANKGLSNYTRLRKEFVIITESEKGLMRNPKGSLVRAASVKKFEVEIERLCGGRVGMNHLII
ncbi:AMP-binding enzyme [Aaosphaeria arxii CBS 175.79]|uniref:AMP-binding enzyme n=1 Tax=Aaosphaeria arxii CBS 175.79 TaxID=1450172 RepID=A0A6A5XYN7_9PLEO|nr:AMP-binding enzyme [Aaosphaeria arxii CBS 175.79]KAF2018086.1 AMP-binding enzyme [Aaosphaeria arxii CBS 175.79]